MLYEWHIHLVLSSIFFISIHIYFSGISYLKRVPSRSDVFIDVFTAAVWIEALHSHNYPRQVHKRIGTYITSLYAEEGQNKRK